PVLDEDFACLAETPEGELVGVSLSLPDYNQVLARLNGRLLPLGWLTALRTRHRIAEIRVLALGVKPEFQHTGVAAALYRHVGDACRRRGIKRAETGWILEINEPMNRAMEALVGRIVKRYRVYERLLEPDAVPGLPDNGRLVACLAPKVVDATNPAEVRIDELRRIGAGRVAEVYA